MEGGSEVNCLHCYGWAGGTTLEHSSGEAFESLELSSCSANNKWTPSEEAGHHWLSNGSGVLCFVLSVTSLDSSIFELWGKETKERRKKDN